jgi:hypothetical protein
VEYGFGLAIGSLGSSQQQRREGSEHKSAAGNRDRQFHPAEFPLDGSVQQDCGIPHLDEERKNGFHWNPHLKPTPEFYSRI